MGGLLHLVQPRRAGAPPSPPIAVPNVTAHSSTDSVPTSYYSMWYYNSLCPLKLWLNLSKYIKQENAKKHGSYAFWFNKHSLGNKYVGHKYYSHNLEVQVQEIQYSGDSFTTMAVTGMTSWRSPISSTDVFLVYSSQDFLRRPLSPSVPNCSTRCML